MGNSTFLKSVHLLCTNYLLSKNNLDLVKNYAYFLRKYPRFGKFWNCKMKISTVNTVRAPYLARRGGESLGGGQQRATTCSESSALHHFVTAHVKLLRYRVHARLGGGKKKMAGWSEGRLTQGEDGLSYR